MKAIKPEITLRLEQLVEEMAMGNRVKFLEILNEGKPKEKIISQQKFNRIFNIDNRTNKYPKIPEDVQGAILILPNVDNTWFLTGEGSMLKEDEPETAQERTQKRLNGIKNNAKGVLEYYDGATPAAGREGEAEIATVNKNERKLYISDLFRGSQFAVRISGNSMIPSYPPGAIIGIRQIYDKSIIPGSVYVVETADELYIKRLYYKDDDQDSGAFQCISDNTIIHETGVRKGRPCYPVFYKKFEEIRKLFKVTGIYKPNELTLIN